ncbi:MAG: YceI family protein [Steroidobacteraceae bacterium]
MKHVATGLALGLLAASYAVAAPVTYNVDPGHTFPAFEADHMGGLSLWRGKINSTSGKIVLDTAASTGSVDVTMDMKTIDFGHQKLNEHARGADIFDTEKFPTATYKGKLAGFKNGNPTEVQGELTLHGVTKPVTLKITQFLCKTNPMSKKEVCGADAETHINREEFGVGYGKAAGFKMDVKLLISVEAVKAE